MKARIAQGMRGAEEFLIKNGQAVYGEAWRRSRFICSKAGWEVTQHAAGRIFGWLMEGFAPRNWGGEREIKAFWSTGDVERAVQKKGDFHWS